MEACVLTAVGGYIKFSDYEMNTFRYDRQRLVLKEIHNCQYITCMNPTAGSFSINPRLQVSVMSLINEAPPPLKGEVKFNQLRDV